MTKILLTDIGHPQNKGDVAKAAGLLTALQKFIPEAEVMLPSYYPEKNIKVFGRYEITLIEVKKSRFSKLRPIRALLWVILNKSMRLNSNWLINDSLLKAYATANVIVDLSGDSFAEDTTFKGFFFHAYPVLLGILMGTPVVFCSQSMGPFKTRAGRFLAKFILNKAKFITIREEITKDYLMRTGITKQSIYLLPEVAFLLVPSSAEIVSEILHREGINQFDRPLIGISLNGLLKGILKFEGIGEKYNEYIVLMAKIVDYLVEELGATVIFVPHVITSFGDDRIATKAVLQLVRNKHKVKSFSQEYSPEELKGIIGQCDLFVGERMHANIAAISMCVPTVAIAYSHKTYGIMKMVGQEKYICDIRKMTFDELKFKINAAWYNRKKLKDELKFKLKSVKKSAWLHGKLIKDLVDSEQLS